MQYYITFSSILDKCLVGRFYVIYMTHHILQSNKQISQIIKKNEKRYRIFKWTLEIFKFSIFLGTEKQLQNTSSFLSTKSLEPSERDSPCFKQVKFVLLITSMVNKLINENKSNLLTKQVVICHAQCQYNETKMIQKLIFQSKES